MKFKNLRKDKDLTGIINQFIEECKDKDPKLEMLYYDRKISEKIYKVEHFVIEKDDDETANLCVSIFEEILKKLETLENNIKGE